ncbi:MAG TPA: hypothetical protein VGQ37_21320 [Vicinamibacterales bacterium]|jgi:hypothetical protein|nr:hypothetical protein [Vicinamibacterales bacterium]
MTKRTRLFLFVSVGILVAGLGTGLVAAYVGGFQNLNFLGTSSPDELAYLPSDAKVVAFANVREIMDSELHQKLQALAPRNGDGLARFEEETGVDVTRDVDYVLGAIGGDTAAGPNQGHPLVIARGRFDTVRIEGLVLSKGGTVEDYKGVRLLKVAEPTGGMDAALAFVEPGLIAMGAQDAVRRAIDARKGGTASAAGNEELVRLVKQADDGNAWVVARFDALSAAGQLPPDVLQRLPAINWLTVTGHVNGGIRAAIRAETRDEAAAKNLRDVLQGILALAKLQSGQRADVAAIMDSIELGGEGKNVTLGLAVPIEVIDQLASLRTPGSLAPPAAPQPPQAPEPPTAP